MLLVDSFFSRSPSLGGHPFFDPVDIKRVFVTEPGRYYSLSGLVSRVSLIWCFSVEVVGVLDSDVTGLKFSIFTFL